MRHSILRLAILLSFCHIIEIHGQCTGDVVLTTQAEVNAFTCNGLFDGTLIIDDDGTDPIFTLNPIHINGLGMGPVEDFITGDLIIRNCPSLPDLIGLDFVESIGGSFVVINNASLSSTGQFNFQLETVGGLNIQDNPSLSVFDLPDLVTMGQLELMNCPLMTSLNGFSNVSGSVGLIDIRINPALSDLSGLDNITEVEDIVIHQLNALGGTFGFNSLTTANSINLVGNDGFDTLEGFPSLTEAYSLEIFGNNGMTDLNGFESLVFVDYLKIAFNDGLENIGAFGLITVMDGYLLIDHNSALTDMGSFNNLTEVGGALHISHNSALTEMASFSSLTEVGGSLQINNNGLQTINGFQNLFSSTRLRVFDNPNLQTLNGLTALQQVLFDVRITGNPLLTTIPSLNLLGYVNSIEITNNVNLSNIDGFHGVNNNSIESIIIGSNSSLQSITAFQGLDDVETIEFSENAALTSIDAFGDLDNASEITISSNPSLNTVIGFETIESVSSGLIVSNNAALSECCWLAPLLNVAESDATINIANNDTGCDSEFEVLNSSGELQLSCLASTSFLAGEQSCTVSFNVPHTEPEVICGTLSSHTFSVDFPSGDDFEVDVLNTPSTLVQFPLGQTAMIHTVSSGDVSTMCTTLITVVDDIAPTWDSADLSVTVTGECGVDDPDDLFASVLPTAIDNCSSPTPTYFGPVITPLCGGEQYVYTAQAVDLALNVSEAYIVTVRIEDTQAPLLNCPADITVDCGSSISPSTTGSATGGDTCQQIAVQWEDESEGGSCPEIISRRWYAIDECGNYAECTQTIEIQGQDCPADITGDDQVDIDDFLALNSAFGSSCNGCPADITNDGQVNINDFLALNSAFGQPCPGFNIEE